MPSTRHRTKVASKIPHCYPYPRIAYKDKITPTGIHPLWPALVLFSRRYLSGKFSDLSRWADFWSTVDENKQIITGSQNNVKINSITQKVTTNEFITEIAALRPLPGGSCMQIAFAGPKSASRGPTAGQQWPTSESRLSETCGLSFSVNNGNSERFTAVHIEVMSGYHLKPDDRPLNLGKCQIFWGSKLGN